MQTLTLILFLFCLTSSFARQTSSTVPIKEVKAANVINAAIDIDTNAIPTPDKLLNLPAELTLTSCTIGIASKGQVTRINYSKTATGQFSEQIIKAIKKARPGDFLIFENVFVLKGDRKLKLVDKSFIIRNP